MSLSPSMVAGEEGMRQDVRNRILVVLLPLSLLMGVVLMCAVDLYNWASPAFHMGSLLVLLPLMGWWLWSRRRPLAFWLIPLGYLGLCIVAVHWFPFQAMPCLLLIPSGMAALLLGSGPGVAVATLATAALLVDSRLAAASVSSRAVALTGIWASQAFAWSALRSASQAIAWSSASYARMREMLELARDQRLQLKQTQEDLLKANQELARVSERLRAMCEVAEQARRAKEEFIANVSHELRTPLNMIIGFGEMITQSPHLYGLDLPPRLLSDIDVIERNSEHLASLVNDVLDLSRADAGHMALSREWVSLSEITETAIAAVRPLLESKDLGLAVDIPPDLPPVYCDRTRIRQVVLNLLSNAARYTEHGRILVRLRQERQGLVVSVSDTGPGISPRDQERIFEPFEQIGGAGRRRNGGSGLGLTISRRLVEMHGGRMWLKSEAGKGATFSLELPLDGPATGPHQDQLLRRWFPPDDYYEPRSRPSQAPAPQLVPRFVVFETGRALRQLLTHSEESIEVLATSDLEAAIREVSRLPSHALVINDPSFGEIVASRESFSGLPYGTPVLGCWCPDERAAAERLGLVSYLVKPIRREALLAALDKLHSQVHKILVVDDDPDAIWLFDRMLTSAERGYQVIRAATGRRALSLLRRQHPDVMLIDLIMPDMDGYEVLEEKSRDPSLANIPAIAISAQDPIAGPTQGYLIATKGGGFSAQDLLRSIRALSEVLAPPDRLYPGH